MAGLIDDEAVFERLAFLLATPVVLLLFRISCVVGVAGSVPLCQQGGPRDTGHTFGGEHHPPHQQLDRLAEDLVDK